MQFAEVLLDKFPIDDLNQNSDWLELSETYDRLTICVIKSIPIWNFLFVVNNSLLRLKSTVKSQVHYKVKIFHSDVRNVLVFR